MVQVILKKAEGRDDSVPFLARPLPTSSEAVTPSCRGVCFAFVLLF